MREERWTQNRGGDRGYSPRRRRRVLRSGSLVQRGRRRVPGYGIFETTTRSEGEDKENPEKGFTSDEEFGRPTMAGGSGVQGGGVCVREGRCRAVHVCGKGLGGARPRLLKRGGG
jgi:hypothetical protein